LRQRFAPRRLCVLNKMCVVVAALVFILAGASRATTHNDASPQQFARASAPYTFRFPRDHFAHDAYRTEWWYFTGHLRAKDGRRFGFELTFFRIGLVPHAKQNEPGRSIWRAAQIYPADFAITDEHGGRYFFEQTLARDALGQGKASEHAFDVRANGWSLVGTTDVRPRMRLRARQAGNALDLMLVSQKPPAIHGHGGI
jgi:predicted secreted hydrolase